MDINIHENNHNKDIDLNNDNKDIDLNNDNKNIDLNNDNKNIDLNNDNKKNDDVKYKEIKVISNNLEEISDQDLNEDRVIKFTEDNKDEIANKLLYFIKNNKEGSIIIEKTPYNITNINKQDIEQQKSIRLNTNMDNTVNLQQEIAKGMEELKKENKLEDTSVDINKIISNNLKKMQNKEYKTGIMKKNKLISRIFKKNDYDLKNDDFEGSDIFGYFSSVRSMNDQIISVLDQNEKIVMSGKGGICNLVVVGGEKTGKTNLAIDIIKVLKQRDKIHVKKVAIIKTDAFNKKDIKTIVKKVKGGALILEEAQNLSDKAVNILNEEINKYKNDIFVVLEGDKKGIEELLYKYKEFSKKFNLYLNIPEFINDELVLFSKTYAKEKGYEIDKMAILAIYSKIDEIQLAKNTVNMEDIKNMIDNAIKKSKQSSLQKTLTGLFKNNKNVNILKETDFY